MIVEDQPHITAILSGLLRKFQQNEVVPRVFWFVGPDEGHMQTVAEQLLQELGGDPNEWVIHMAVDAADVPIEDGAKGLVLHFHPPRTSGPLFAPAFLDAVVKADIARALVVAMDYAGRTGEVVGLVDECIEMLGNALAAGRADKRLIDGIRALWEIRHRLVSSPVPLGAALPALMAEMAAVLAQIPYEAVQATTEAPAVTLDAGGLRAMVSNG